jgi:hypothetical protein
MGYHTPIEDNYRGTSRDKSNNLNRLHIRAMLWPFIGIP